DWPPFDFVENGKYTGIAKEYLTLIEKSTGLKFNYVFGYSWNQLLSLTKERKLDLLPILAKTEDREKYLLYTDKSYISIRDYLFSSSQKFNSLDELNGKTLAVPAGYAQEEYLKKNYPKIKVILVKDVLQGIDYVILNKVDALISNIALVDYFTKKHNLTGINAQFALIENDNLYMAFRDDYPILKSIIQKALANITQIEKNKISDKFLVNFHDDEDFTFSKEELEFIKNNKKIYIANELDWIPYDYNDDGIAKGYIIDYTKLLFSKIGMEPIFITDTWQNIMKKFKNNDINVLPVISYNKKREEILNYSNAFLQQEFSIVTKSSRFDLINFDDLKGKKVALIKSWNSTKIIKENYPDINIVEFDNIKDIFEAVKNNIVDATIQNSILSSFYIKKDYNEVLKNDATVRIKNFDTSLYMGVNKDKPILKELINKSMKQISRQEMKTLNNKWLDDRTKIDFTVKEKQFIENTIVKVVFTDNWGPINFVEDGKAYGLGYDFWKLIVNKANLKTTIDYKDNFSSALKAIELKENDLIIATTKTKDREKYAIFSNTFHKAPIGIATLQDKNYIPNASYLVGKKVGVGRNYTAHKILQKLYPRIEFVFVKDIKEGLQLLSNNEIYAVVDNMPVLAHNIKKYAYSDVKISGNTGLDFNLQVMIRDDYPILQSIVNKVLAELSAEEKETIYNKWAKIDFEKEIDYLSYLKFVIPLLLVILFILYKNRELVRYQKSLKLTKYELENTLKSFRTLVDLTI
ncbi:transporter substrate-binding domain-containing protein, partial [Poseidonibacter sp.]|uniref:transporter substrate-binding domain-containing protein n=1 Tax=Poseidonibacter sp. TaxID=2321188 RepID=UPI003C773B63